MPILAFNPDPIVGIMPDKFVGGIATLEESSTPMQFYKLSDAVNHLWPTDSHIVFYSLVDVKGVSGACPRLKKGIERRVRDAGGEVVSTCFGFDFDTPDHAPWAPGQFNQWFALLESISHQWPDIMHFSHLYSTRNGARMIYVLSQPLPVDIAEAKHRGMVQMFNRYGLTTDKLSDWTRLFRLPKVHRDNAPTTQEPDHLVLSNPHAVLDESRLHEVDRSEVQAYADIHEIRDPKPTVEEARTLLENTNTSTGYKRKTEWFKKAKKRLDTRDCYPCIFDHQPIAVKGNRNNTIHSYVGQACSMLINVPHSTPQHVYALFLEAVLQLEPEHDTPDWSTVLWDHCCRIWAKEDASLRESLKHVLPDGERATTIGQQMVEGMREWNNHAMLMSEDEQTSVGFMLRHAIASVGKHLFVMQHNGYYSTMPLSKDQLVSELMCRGLTDLIPVQKLSSTNNTIVSVSPQDIQNKYSVNAGKSIEYRPNMSGGFLSDLGKPNGTPKLILSCYKLNPELTPRFDPGVDAWFRAMFQDEYHVFEDWAKWVLAYTQGPIAAISLVGAPNSGKKLIVEGLAECLEDPQIASAKDIVNNFNGGLMKSPFVVVNEGWPEGSNKTAADAFRDIIDDRIYVNEKFMPLAEIHTKPRIIMTANNLNIIKTLAGRGTMSVDDREALSQRLLHFSIGDSSAKWLRAQGGLALTGKPGAKWIANAERQSDFILARHFLYLHSIRGEKPNTRYLVEGNGKHEVIFSMQTETGSTPIVIECIIKMLLQYTTMNAFGFLILNNRLYATTSEILKFYRLEFSSVAGNERLNNNKIADVLKSLTLTEDFHKTSRRLHTREGSRLHWHDLDCRLLRQVARRIGADSPALEALAEGQTVELGPIDTETVQSSIYTGTTTIQNPNTPIYT